MTAESEDFRQPKHPEGFHNVWDMPEPDDIPKSAEKPYRELRGFSRMHRRAVQIANLVFKLENFEWGEKKRQRMEGSLWALIKAQASYGNGKGRHHKEQRRY